MVGGGDDDVVGCLCSAFEGSFGGCRGFEGEGELNETAEFG